MSQQQPLFISLPGRGQRFALLHVPEGSLTHSVLYLHPFAEEMNKSRRMAALQARAFARAGCAVLQLDLLGCGDSSGDFGDATWDDWIQDALQAARWLRERHEAPLVLWGLRAGCLIASATARALAEPIDLCLWQPALDGAGVLRQFLRLALAAQLNGAGASGAATALQNRLDAGEAVDVAGYRLGAGLAAGLAAARLEPLAEGRVAWLEVSSRNEPALLPASAQSVSRWRADGHEVAERAVRGAAFWQSVEIEEVPDLVPSTLSCMGLGAPRTAAA